MNVVIIFLLIFVAFIAAAVFIQLSNKFAANNEVQVKQYNNSNLTANKPAYQYTPTPTWGPPDSNTACNTYTFIGGQYTPAAPSYQKLNQDGYRGVYVGKFSPSTCLDIDQLYAQDVTIECQNPSGTNAGAGCILSVPTFVGGVEKYPGDYVPVNTKQGSKGEPGSSPFFAQCVPTTAVQNQSGSYYCSGNIGVVIPNFTPQTSYTVNQNNCLVGDYNGITGAAEFIMGTSIQVCDLSEPQQIFRTIRYSLDSSGNLNQDDQGNLAAIVHRYTGYYLAPELTKVADPVTATYDWVFKAPIINTKAVTDNLGNSYPQYINLKLINPAYDTYRNGVYWLLQNRTFSAQYANTNADLDSYLGQGILVNQQNYTKQFPTGPSVPGFINSLFINAGSSGAGYPSDISPESPGTVSQTCNTTPFIPDTPMGPQQIVYVPDINLLPTNNQDPDAMWSYLVNNYSINILNDNTPVLTPYRTSINTIQYSYTNKSDPDDGSNNFCVFSGYGPTSGSTGPDSQFIEYTSFRTQIFIPVSGGASATPPTNASFSNYSNPFTSPN